MELLYKIGMTACLTGIVGVLGVKFFSSVSTLVETLFGMLAVLSIIVAPICLVSYIWLS